MKRLLSLSPAAFVASLLTLIVCDGTNPSLTLRVGVIAAEEPRDGELARSFREVVQPFLTSYCQGCHAKEMPKGKLDLTSFASVGQVSTAHQTWQTILERLEAGE